MARTHVDRFNDSLAASITDSETSFDLSDASGLGTIASGDFIPLTISSGTNFETIHVTAVSTNTITCTRGEDGTTAQAWDSGDKVECLLSSEGIDNKVDNSSDQTVAGLKTFTGLATFDSGINLGADDLTEYEEGDWTPVPQGSSTAGSPSGTFGGAYTRVGDRVFLTCQLVFTDLDTMAGVLDIDGLPFSFDTGAKHRGGAATAFRNNFATDFPIGGFLSSSTVFRCIKADQNNVTVQISDLTNTTGLYFSMFLKI